jgi:hypothetical protein
MCHARMTAFFRRAIQRPVEGSKAHKNDSAMKNCSIPNGKLIEPSGPIK